MVEVTVFTEGQTEEHFVKQVIAPSVRPLEIYVKPLTLKTSMESRGGAISYDRLKFYARNTLRSNSEGVLTTFLDLYGLNTDFPGSADAQARPDVYKKVAYLEKALHENIVKYVKCRAEQFKPHIQPYEFEGLLFSNTSVLASTEPEWRVLEANLAKVRKQFTSPEHINDSYDTKPSKRLEDILQPTYKKTRHGPIAAKQIGLQTIERECEHFHSWMDWLRGLDP